MTSEKNQMPTAHSVSNVRTILGHNPCVRLSMGYTDHCLHIDSGRPRDICFDVETVKCDDRVGAVCKVSCTLRFQRSRRFLEPFHRLESDAEVGFVLHPFFRTVLAHRLPNLLC